MSSIWQQCLVCLQEEMPADQFKTWVQPLQVDVQTNGLRLLAPNKFVLDWVKDRFLDRIKEILGQLSGQGAQYQVHLVIGTKAVSGQAQQSKVAPKSFAKSVTAPLKTLNFPGAVWTECHTHLNKGFTFGNFVEGKSNALARAAAFQIAENPGGAYNPLFLYGGVGLGKTHLMHAVGNTIKARDPDVVIVYMNSENFVSSMVRALQHNVMDDFKKYFRSVVSVLLIDDIQFFAGKGRTQEEFFHTFNALVDAGQQIVLTSDRFPRQLDGVEERLKSRFSWGLSVGIDPPELETRVAILMSKAEQSGVDLPSEVAFFIAQYISTNIRELEGALKRVIANAHFTGQAITLEFAKAALKDLLVLHAKQVSIDNIQRTVAKYYKIKVADLLSKRRLKSITHPRQMAMALAKDLTNHSLPEIGEAFGGRDHTTVLHAHRKMYGLLDDDILVKEDYAKLIRLLTV